MTLDVGLGSTLIRRKEPVSRTGVGASVSVPTDSDQVFLPIAVV